MPTERFILIIIFLAFLTPATSYGGKLYKWVDKDGVVHVTDDPEKIPNEHPGTVKKSAPESKVETTLAKAKEIWKQVKDKIASVIAILVIITLLYLMLKYTKSRLNEKKREKCLRALKQSGIDNLDHAQFREYIGALLAGRGFSLKKPDGTLDLGVDLIAEGDKTKYAVKIKRQSSPVSRTVVNDLEREKHLNSCSRAMIISNDYFTDDAAEIAISNGCELVDREKLGEWILDSKRGL